jgi:regulatory protein YycI of two-component signal transduction system YycFG
MYTQVLFIVIIIILMVLLYNIVVEKRNMTEIITSVKSGVNRGLHLGQKTEGVQLKSPEARFLKENSEFFSTCGCDASGEDADYKYATTDYGAPGMDYKDWIASKAIDPQVIKNHNEFVKDMVDSGVNKTGPTYDPGLRKGEMEGSDLVPWTGLRRPQMVPIGNPDQVPDFNSNTYTKKAKFTWDSSSID